MNYARFLTAVSSARRPSPIRALTAILQKGPPSIISLAGGLPNPDLFPFDSAEIKLRDGRTIALDETKMKRALQYGASQGMTELVGWLKEFQKEAHNPPTMNQPADQGGLDLCMTSGVQEGLGKSIDMLISEGDNVLIESPTFSGSIDGFVPKGCKLLPIETDEDGMKPESLRSVLSRWKPEDAKNPMSDIPRVVYTIPNGVNPTGTSLSTNRRKEIYQIAREYDLLILEDDPYYFIQFTEPRPSLLSLDEDGRVLRFDSFSKVLSAGLRVGFLTGPGPLVQKIVQHVMVSSMHPSMISQMMAYEFLNCIGKEGFKQHTKKVAEFYKSQRNHMLQSAEKWLKDKAEWTEPKAGMFLWLKLKGVEDTEKLIMEKALAKEVLFVPGKSFMPGARGQPCPFVRASYSLASPEKIDVGIQRLASVIEEEWKESGYKPQ